MLPKKIGKRPTRHSAALFSLFREIWDPFGTWIIDLFLGRGTNLPCPTRPPGTCAPRVKSCWASTCHYRIRSRLPRAVALSRAVSIPAAISREPRHRAPARKRWSTGGMRNREIRDAQFALLVESFILCVLYVQWSLGDQTRSRSATSRRGTESSSLHEYSPADTRIYRTEHHMRSVKSLLRGHTNVMRAKRSRRNKHLGSGSMF